MLFHPRLFMALTMLCLLAGGRIYAADPMPRPALSLSPDSVDLLEDHQEALVAWLRRGISNATVVHVDAHHDLLSARPASAWKPLQAALKDRQMDRILTFGDELMAGHLYDLSSYLVPAWDLGVVNQIWWIYPHQAPFDSELLEQLKDYLRYQQMGTFREEEISAWHLDGNVLRGTLRNIPVTVSRIEDLPDFKQPVLLDIDCDYFVGDAGLPVAFDMSRLTMKDRVRQFLAVLASKRLHVQAVTIAHSVSGDYLPLRHRYLGRLLEEQLVGVGGISDIPAEPWSSFWQAEAAFGRDDFAAARGGFTKVSAHKHWLADSADYYLALIAALQGDDPLAVTQIKALVTRNQDYTWGLFDIGSIARRRQDYAAAEVLFLWAIGRGGRWAYEGHMELGRMLAETGRHRDAEREFRKAHSLYPQLAPATVLLAHSLMSLYRFGDAYTLYREVWESREAHYEYRDRTFLPNLVRSALVVGNLGLAQEAIQRLQHVDPEHPELNGLSMMLGQAAGHRP